jgi:pimeloyl-ACP methyl ester carboxylesterase
MIESAVRYHDAAFAQAGDVRLCYDAFGDPADPPVVFIMGLAAQMIVWDDEFCRQLAARGRYVVRFDNRDIGRSTKFDGARAPSAIDFFLSRLPGRTYRAPYTLVDMARDTAGLMDALGLETAHVVGASMGGAIAQEMAIHFRSRLRTLTTIMASTGNPRLPPPTPKAFAALVRSAPREREAFLRYYVKTWRVLSGNVLPFDAERTRRQGLASYERGINPPGVRRQLAAIIASGNRRPALRSVSIPTLVIHGTADPLLRFPAALDLRDAIPGATLVAVEGMGHALPPVLWPKILAAIERHTATNAP